MLCFPQLATGANGQFPFERTLVQRTILSEQPGGETLRLADADAERTEWRLTFRGLSDEELAALETLFTAAEGRLGEFTFLDPLDNLLRWSEGLEQAAWLRDAGLTLTAAVADPAGGTAAARIEGTGEVRQAIAAPAGLQYCFSAWVRGAATLLARAGSAEQAQTVDSGEAWRRVEHPVKLASAAEAVEFGVRLAGGAAEFYGLQVDAQVCASAYKRTGARAGVHSAARFDGDSLEVITRGRDWHDCRVRLAAGAPA